MNWPLIFLLSGFGAIIGAGSLFGATHGITAYVWVIVWVFSAIMIARRTPTKFFLHGFVAGAFANLACTIIQQAFFSTYEQYNPDLTGMQNQLPGGLSVQAVMLILAPFAAAISGSILGLFALLAHRLQTKKPRPADAASEPPVGPRHT
jgi:hypothetical protein